MNSKEIKELRGKLLLSQVEFAKKLRVSVITVSSWENRRSKPNKKATLRRLKRLQVRVENAELRRKLKLVGLN